MRRWLLLVGCAVARSAAADTPAGVAARAEAEHVCAAHEAGCDWLATLGTLERMSTERALAARHLEPDPEPWGKVIEDVHVFNEPPFVEGGKLLRIGNIVHVTTQERAIRDELTIHKGEVWDQLRVEESVRRLHDPLYSSVVAAIPVKAQSSNKVSLLVVTRDIFSLRLNSSYTFQSGTLTNLNLSLSENNFLGTRDLLAAAMTMDLGSLRVGPVFEDKNVLGTHVQLIVRVDDVLTRQAVPLVAADGSHLLGPVPGDAVGIQDKRELNSEGSDSSISLQYPLWSLASEWGGGLTFSHNYSVVRQFVGTRDGSAVGLRPFDAPETSEVEALPREYELRAYSVSASAVRQWGDDIKQQLSFGYNLASQKPSLLASFPTMSQQLRESFIDHVLPVTEVDSAPFVEYFTFQPQFKTLRNVDTYDLAEDLRYGFALDASVSRGFKFLGGDFNFTRPSLSAAYTWLWGEDGFLGLIGNTSVRRQGGEWIDNTASLSFRAVTPTALHGRFVTQVVVSTRWDDTQNRFLSIGATTGLRAFGDGVFFGQRVVSGIFELRSLPWSVWVFRVGGVAFYEAGGAAQSIATTTVFQDYGFGLRFLIPQTSRELFRFDLAFPINGEPFGAHFIAGFGSYF